MCGLTGLLDLSRTTSTDLLAEHIQRMASCLHHRGPDDRGHWVDAAHGIALGHTRLAIQDLSPAGHQPMASASQRFQIVFNGEIYNHLDLRRQLPSSVAYRGHSDTETLLAGFEHWGIRQTIERSIGMFAIAVWDGQTQTLTLIRDRMGIKPLYYGKFGSTILFGSELKALRSHPAFVPTIDRGALGLFLRFNAVPNPYSIYESVWKLPQGTFLTIPGQAGPLPEPVEFWSFRRVTDQGLQSPFPGSYEEAVDELDRLLTNAVGLRMLSDVPLGAFLSGGIDSSLVTALMQKQSATRIKTFSIGFDEAAYNEAPYAKLVAEHLGTQHTEHYVTGREALDVIPLLPRMFDEPFADSSQIPTYLVSALARKDVTVALSGDGGDELFCGYRRYFDAQKVHRIARWIPRPFRQLVAASASQLGGLSPNSQWGRMARRGASLLTESSPEAIYRRHMQHWRSPLPLVPGTEEKSCEFLDLAQWPPYTPEQLRWMSIDTRCYLPNDILTKVDRTSMAVALEARVPLIDHRVVEFAWRLPLDFKTEGRQGKRILREVLARYVPPALFERPKTGFGVPLETWLRGPLREWAEDLLSEDRLRREGYFQPEPIRQCWAEHLSGKRDWHYWIWDILMFQAWLAEG